MEVLTRANILTLKPRFWPPRDKRKRGGKAVGAYTRQARSALRLTFRGEWARAADDPMKPRRARGKGKATRTPNFGSATTRRLANRSTVNVVSSSSSSSSSSLTSSSTMGGTGSLSGVVMAPSSDSAPRLSASSAPGTPAARRADLSSFQSAFFSLFFFRSCYVYDVNGLFWCGGEGFFRFL